MHCSVFYPEGEDAINVNSIILPDNKQTKPRTVCQLFADGLPGAAVGRIGSYLKFDGQAICTDRNRVPHSLVPVPAQEGVFYLSDGYYEAATAESEHVAGTLLVNNEAVAFSQEQGMPYNFSKFVLEYNSEESNGGHFSIESETYPSGTSVVYMAFQPNIAAGPGGIEYVSPQGAFIIGAAKIVKTGSVLAQGAKSIGGRTPQVVKHGVGLKNMANNASKASSSSAKGLTKKIGAGRAGLAVTSLAAVAIGKTFFLKEDGTPSGYEGVIAVLDKSGVPDIDQTPPPIKPEKITIPADPSITMPMGSDKDKVKVRDLRLGLLIDDEFFSERGESDYQKASRLLKKKFSELTFKQREFLENYWIRVCKQSPETSTICNKLFNVLQSSGAMDAILDDIIYICTHKDTDSCADASPSEEVWRNIKKDLNNRSLSKLYKERMVCRING